MISFFLLVFLFFFLFFLFLFFFFFNDTATTEIYTLSLHDALPISTVVLPYLLAAFPLLPDEVSKWLLRLTPAAGFAVEQTIRQYPQVVAHYAPSEGYFPLAWWAGFAVLCGYTAIACGLALSRIRRRVA